jgi:hypothetical protein
MEEQTLFLMVLEIAKQISSECKSSKEARQVLRLIQETLAIRWAIYQA